MKKTLISIIMGSTTDLPTMQSAVDVLSMFGVSYEVRVLSAHRSPDEAASYAKGLTKRGVAAVIAGAGGAAHLPGVIASHTVVPVIGVPMKTSSFQGMDSLLSIVQMPGGIPVATMAVGQAGAKNAALFALQLCAMKDARLAQKVLRYKKKMRSDVIKKDREVSARNQKG